MCDPEDFHWDDDIEGEPTDGIDFDIGGEG